MLSSFKQKDISSTRSMIMGHLWRFLLPFFILLKGNEWNFYVNHRLYILVSYNFVFVKNNYAIYSMIHNYPLYHINCLFVSGCSLFCFFCAIHYKHLYNIHIFIFVIAVWTWCVVFYFITAYVIVMWFDHVSKMDKLISADVTGSALELCIQFMWYIAYIYFCFTYICYVHLHD